MRIYDSLYFVHTTINYSSIEAMLNKSLNSSHQQQRKEQRKFQVKWTKQQLSNYQLLIFFFLNGTSATKKQT